MKKIFEPMKLFISMLLLGWSFCFVACSDDDKIRRSLPDEITTETMFGDYTGKMSAVTQSPEKVAPKMTKQTKEWLLQHMSITIPYILKNFPSKILSCPSLKMKPQQTKS